MNLLTTLLHRCGRSLWLPVLCFAMALPARAQGIYIYSQPQNQVATVGQSATFVVEAADELGTPSFQWSKSVSNGPWTNVSGAVGTSYTTPATTLSNSGNRYRVVVSIPGQTSVTSNIATLTVTTDTMPVITSHPVAATRTVGQSATFTVTATGSPLSYRWYRNVIYGSAIWELIPGATGSSYTLSTTSVLDNMYVYAEVYNQRGSAGSNSAYLGVNGPPVILTQPTSRSVNAGNVTTFNVGAVGSGLSWQWYKNNVAVAGAISAAWNTPAVQASDNGAQIKVVVTNSYGSVTSSVATLSVNLVPTITVQPVGQTVYATYPVTFSVGVQGSSPFTYQWKKGGVAIPGATSATYAVANTVTADAGSYSVRVTNAFGFADSQSVTLAVNPLPPAPTISSHPQPTSVVEGGNATFSVTASSAAPLSYQWQRDGVNLPGETYATYTLAAATIANDHGHTYRVLVTNPGGTTPSNEATLSVTSAGTAPSFTTQPAAITVAAGQRATFTVAVSGTAPFTYAWRRNGAIVAPSGGTTYTTEPLALGNDQDAYDVVITNAAGTITSATARVTVSSQPVGVTVNPAATSLGAGDTTTFTATVTLTTNTAVTWSVQEGAAGGTISAAGGYVAPSAAGTYHVVATSVADPSRSGVATVTVLPKSHLAIRP